MPRIPQCFIIALACLAMSFAPAHAADLVRKQSDFSAVETVARLKAAVETRGARVFAEIDHAGGAASVGEELAPTWLVIFGNPAIGTPLMRASQEMGLHLPLHVLIYEDAGGDVWAAYEPIEAIAERRGVKDGAAALTRVAGALNAITNEATGESN